VKFKNILFLVIINLFSIINVCATSNPYKQSGPYGTNCTWYAWKMAYEKGGVTLSGLGDAKNWYKNASNKGYSVGTTPKSNSIVVCCSWTEYGHVGYVEKVIDNTLYVWDSASYCINEEDEEYKKCMAESVCEETDRACKNNAKQVACKYNLSDYEITGFIYLNESLKTQEKKEEVVTNKEDKKEVEVVKSNNNYLNSIELSEGIIDFKKDILEYSLDVEYETENITIYAKTEDNKSLVNGVGDYKLSVGINEIKLIVTAEDKSTKEYILKINRKEKLEIKEELNTEIDEEKIKIKDNKKISLIIEIVGIVFIFGLGTTILILKNKKKQSK